jgi:predicted methyltransferase
MKVADLAAGGGYTTEFLARAVGPSGKVYAQNTKWVMDKFAAKPWAARVARPINGNVVSLVREFDDPLPPEAKDLDIVVDVLVYHDTFWMNGAGAGGTVDRDKMNHAVLAALKTGGVYGIVDHSGRPGTGAEEVQTLHRIEEKVVVDEVLRAGFKLAEEGDFLRNPADTRDWNDAPFAAGDRRGKSDRFVLKFVKTLRVTASRRRGRRRFASGATIRARPAARR